MLIPLTVVLLAVYEKQTIHQSPPLVLLIGISVFFGLLAGLTLLPKITIRDKILVQRNSLGYTSKPIDLVRLRSIEAIRAYRRLGLLLVPLWVLRLTDEAGNSTAITLGGWKHETSLRQMIASSPTGSNVDVNDRAIELLGL